jgi:PKD repeat protein
MMKQTKSTFIKRAFLLLGVISFVAFSACTKEDDPVVEDPIASFQFSIDEENYLTVAFENFSQNAETYSWNFGDNQTSTEMSPTHTYAEAGNYTVVLTATNSAGVSANFSETIEVTDPDEALKLLTGDVSKTWKLFREGVSMSLGPNAAAPAGWWAGLENNGARPCVYEHEFTFHLDGTYVFNDNGVFWGEFGVFNDKWNYEICFEATSANMRNRDDADVSAWLSDTHSFTYNPSLGTVTLNGEGAWIGIPKLGTTGETLVPASSVTFNVEITEHTGYDLMTVTFDYGDGNADGGGLWTIVYASYSNPALEPAIVVEQEPWGESLPNLTPTELYHTFESETSFAHLGAIGGTSIITVGEDDPADGETKVGKFERVAGEQWQEAQLRTHPDLYDIQFDNFNVAKIDIYIPADTDFADGGLQRFFVFGFADMSQTQEWWNSPTQFTTEGDDVVLGEWHTYTFDLTDVKEREDIDMIFLGIGGGGHTTGGVFYIRNLVFE